jgi:hypothetical protein
MLVRLRPVDKNRNAGISLQQTTTRNSYQALIRTGRLFQPPFTGERNMKTRLIALSLMTIFSAGAWAADPAPASAGGSKRQEAAQRMKGADTDKDGAISKAEAEAAKMQHLTTNFDKLDSNKDGKVTHEEMRAARKAHKAGKQ